MRDILDELVAKGVRADIITEIEKWAKAFYRRREWNRVAQHKHRVRSKSDVSLTAQVVEISQISKSDSKSDRGGYISSLSSSLSFSQEEERGVCGTSGRAKFQYPQEFDAFWQQYPLNAGKGAAHKAWVKVLKAGKASNEELIAGAMRYAADPNRIPEFTKHAERWLNAGCWNDGPLPQRKGNGHGKQDTLDLCRELADECREREREIDEGLFRPADYGRGR